jgi:protein-tyrosine-phosphatase
MILACGLTAMALRPATLFAQAVPSDYQGVLTTLARTGDFKDNVLKVNIPRNDLRVTIRQRPAPTPFGFGGWVALTKGQDGMDVMMGDLVLVEDEVNPVMSALLKQGLQVTALHNHFFWDQPRIFYMHVHGMGRAADLATKLKPAIAIIDEAIKRAPAPTVTTPPAATLDGAALAKIVGHEGEQNGAVYKITIGRPDVDLREHGAAINARMGLNTWAAFAGTPADAMVAGDVAMLEGELPKVLSTLRASNIDVVAIHHHMTDVKPMVVFLHYFGTGSAEALARAVRAAVDQLGPSRAPAAADARIMFVCEHGAAKSLIAAAYFNKLATERGLPDRAMFRGSDPQEAISIRAVEGLRADGVAIPDGKPTAIDASDVNKVTHIFAIGCVLPKVAASSGKAADWSDVPDDKGYGPMRDAIVTHVRAVVDDIQRRKP